jgi:hypothetical protein
VRLLLLLKQYSKGKYIYPGVLIRELNIDMSLAYKVLDAIKDLGVLAVIFEVYCHSCSRFTGEVFETLSEMPEELECYECDRTLSPLTASIVVYRVVVDE